MEVCVWRPTGGVRVRGRDVDIWDLVPIGVVWVLVWVKTSKFMIRVGSRSEWGYYIPVPNKVMVQQGVPGSEVQTRVSVFRVPVKTSWSVVWTDGSGYDMWVGSPRSKVRITTTVPLVLLEGKELVMSSLKRTSERSVRRTLETGPT